MHWAGGDLFIFNDTTIEGPRADEHRSEPHGSTYYFWQKRLSIEAKETNT
jgi:hypothetical protein